MSESLSNEEPGEEYRKALQAVRDYVFENHKFPSVREISDLADIPRARCSKVCDQLVRQNQLYIVFEGKGVPKVYLPYDMMQGVLRTQKKPDWLRKTSYSFVEKHDASLKIEQLDKEITMYEMFERLLYATDIPLEEAIAFALSWLGFDNVVHHKEQRDNPDITFDFEGCKALVEVEGTTKSGDKRKVLQLDGWVRREIETAGKKRDELQGIFVVNHFRDIEPDSRADPLTGHAKEFLKHYHFRFFTTRFLFDVVKKVREGMSKEEARGVVWEGEEVR